MWVRSFRRVAESERMTESPCTPEMIYLDGPSGGHARWRFCRLLGVGGFAKVYEVEDEMGRLAACKAILADTPERKARARCEIGALKAAQSHRNVVGLIGATQVGDTFYVVQELQTGDILDEVLRKRGLASEQGGEARSQRIVSQLLHALVHLHRRNIVHGYVATLHCLSPAAVHTHASPATVSDESPPRTALLTRKAQPQLS